MISAIVHSVTNLTRQRPFSTLLLSIPLYSHLLTKAHLPSTIRKPDPEPWVKLFPFLPKNANRTVSSGDATAHLLRKPSIEEPLHTFGGTVEILSIRWTAVLVEEFEESVRFFQEVMGIPLDLYDEARQFAFFWWEEELQAFEVFGLDAEVPDEMNCAVAGFQVANLHSARAELEGFGIEFLGETTITPNGSGWAYFLGPDDFV